MPSGSSRSKKRAALARMRQGAGGRLGGANEEDIPGNSSDASDDDNDNVYEYLDEAEYQKLVDRRRQQQDFVIDDDGLGYHDDGEERFGDEVVGADGREVLDTANAKSGKGKRKQTNTASLTQQALRKARRRAAAQSAGAAATAAAAGQTQSMWNFVNQAGGKTNAKNATSSTGNPSSKKKKQPTVRPSVDALLDTLDNDSDAEIIQQRSRRNGPKKRKHRVSRRSLSRPKAPMEEPSYAKENNHDHNYEDDDKEPQEDNDTPMPFDDEDEDDNGGNANTDNNPPEDTPMPDATPEKAPSSSDASPAQSTESTTEEPPKEAPRRRRPKQGQVSRALQRKKAAQAAAPDESPSSATATATATATDMPLSTVTLKPQLVDDDGAANDSTNNAKPGAFLPTTGKVALADVLTPATAEDAEAAAAAPYLDLFWTDLCERNGDIMIFGKVALPPKTESSSNSKKPQPTQYASCSVLVQGTVRNLFVLPRPDAALQDVHAEVNTLLKSSVLPRASGASWAGKPVQRQYAFGDPTVPRKQTTYLKVVYKAAYPVPPTEVCQKGGEHFSHILNAQASPTETFLIKRGLKGPGWIRIQNPQPTQAPLSWCATECRVDSPKQIAPILDARPAPPLVTVALKIKTVPNPTTHRSEIVSVSAVGHTRVHLESNEPSPTRQLSLIRPVHAPGANPKTAAVFPRDLPEQVAAKFRTLQTVPNERALLSRLLATLAQWDPDFWIGHAAWNYELDVLLARCAALKLQTVWSKLGRRRRSGLPKSMNNTNGSSGYSNRDWVISDAIAGRLVCDTYLSSQELLRETTYSLSNLAATQLQCQRQEIEPADVPRWFAGGGETVCQLALATLWDAQLVQRLATKLQVLPLTKQLTNIAGNLWSQTLRSNRAVRTEFLLLHEFHRAKFLPPEKQKRGEKATSSKAKYAGGLVLEPKKGLYDSFILLLDFNSLYPSIIQEYNLCFTTMNWAPAAVAEGSELPDVPDPSVARGVLPRVIQSLVERRRTVKKLLKAEANPDKKEELDIRQKALKLTANSMYGCLGFSNSRFYAQPIAALVTSMGRDTLQRTVTVAQQKVGLDVIYGDTDSIMINTRINDEADLPKVKELGERVKREVNRLYKTLELEIDGIFRSMLLLKKKKYAAKTVEEGPNGQIKYGQELKGLDLVRRDWCIQSKETGRYVTEQILSGEDSELVLENIHQHMEDLAKQMRSGELALEKYTITKGLSKHPNEYPDAKSQPHVQVAKRMLASSKAVNQGDHIPYIVTEETPATEGETPKASSSSADRARHPEEIARSNGKLKPDVEWYLTQQILPPIARLCDPIQGTSQQILAEKLGLDAARYNQAIRAHGDVDADEMIDFTPVSTLSDAERFKDVEKFQFTCAGCNEATVFPGVFRVQTDTETGAQTILSGLSCPNPECGSPRHWGYGSHFGLYARLRNNIEIYARDLQCKYASGRTRCDDPACNLQTCQLSVTGGVCLLRGCRGKSEHSFSERAAYNHLKYLDALFNVDHQAEQLVNKKLYGNKAQILKNIHKSDKATFDELHMVAEGCLSKSAYNWISPSFWSGLFAGKLKPVAAKQ